MRDIDKDFAEFDRPGAPGLVWMSIEQGNPNLVRSYGLANLETGVRCEPRTNFRLASVSKQFTAMAIMILAEQGALALDDTLSRFLPRFPSYAAEITIRHLLTHTSGLLDYENLIPPGTIEQLRDHDVLDILQRQEKTYFVPGSQFRYSNSGYVLLGLIVEIVAKRSFAEFLREAIFLPLGMEATVAYESGVSEIPYRALGYSKRGEGFEQTDQNLTSATLGDGGIYSSVEDLFKWDQGLYTEKLVSQAMLREAFAAHSSVSDMPGSGYGFGWYVGGGRVWHNGSTCGFSTRIERHPQEQKTIILLANRRDAGLEEISRGIL